MLYRRRVLEGHLATGPQPWVTAVVQLQGSGNDVLQDRVSCDFRAQTRKGTSKSLLDPNVVQLRLVSEWCG